MNVLDEVKNSDLIADAEFERVLETNVVVPADQHCRDAQGKHKNRKLRLPGTAGRGSPEVQPIEYGGNQDGQNTVRTRGDRKPKGESGHGRQVPVAIGLEDPACQEI